MLGLTKHDNICRKIASTWVLTPEAALRSNERDLIAQVLLGTHLESLDPRRLWMELDDTEPEVFAAFGVDREFLVAKIRQLSAMQLRAIIDEIERRFARGGGEPGEQ